METSRHTFLAGIAAWAPLGADAAPKENSLHSFTGSSFPESATADGKNGAGVVYKIAP